MERGAERSEPNVLAGDARLEGSIPSAAPKNAPRLFHVLEPSGARREMVADDEAEASDMLAPGEMLVVPLTEREVSRRRLDHRMIDRARRDREAAEARESGARTRFVDALVDLPQASSEGTFGWVGKE